MRRGYDCVTDLEKAVLWMIYAAALEARKRRQHRQITQSLAWGRDFRELQQKLGVFGLVL